MKIPSCMTVNVEKVCGVWVVEIYFPKIYQDSIWLAKDKSRSKAYLKAFRKLSDALSKLVKIERKYLSQAVSSDKYKNKYKSLVINGGK